MSFTPTVHSSLAISGRPFAFTEHPAAKGVPYGQSGRRATVYQLHTEDGSLHALKVFTQAFRSASVAVSAGRLGAFSELPGLQVCRRTALTPQYHRDLLSKYPDLTYAVLMSWVDGATWQEIIIGGQPLTPTQSLALAQRLVHILAQMEAQGLAHCDLSGPNVMVRAESIEVALVDVEDLYGPVLTRPEKLPGGSAGYAHRTAPRGLWSAEADRFAGAVMLAEMLGWCDERVRRIAYSEQYFDPAEMQSNSERYQILLTVLRERWDNSLAGLFASAWHSASLTNCPPLSQWQPALAVINSISEANDSVARPAHPFPQDEEASPTSGLDLLRSRAYRLAGLGHWDEVAKVCQEILGLAPHEGSTITLLAQARRQMALGANLETAWGEAMQSGSAADWQEVQRLVREARYQAPKVERYREMEAAAEVEATHALLSERAEQLAIAGQWEEARALLADVPRTHPAAARVWTRMDLEKQRLERTRAHYARAQAALDDEEFQAAVLEAQKGLALGGAVEQFQPMLDRAYRELEIEKQVKALIDSAQATSAAEKYAEAQQQIEQALALRPNRAKLIGLRKDYQQRERWAVQVERARQALAEKAWESAQQHLADVPTDFRDADTLAAQAGVHIEWEAKLRAARQVADAQLVLRLLESQPDQGRDFGDWQSWAESIIALDTQLRTAREHYDLNSIAHLLETAPDDYPERAKLLARVQQELDRHHRIESARLAHDPAAVLELLADGLEDYPERDALQTWAKAELERRQQVQSLYVEGNWESALAVMEGAPDDPFNREWREQIERRLQEQHLLAAHLAEVQQTMAEGRWIDAIHACQAALQIEGASDEFWKLLEKAKAEQGVDEDAEALAQSAETTYMQGDLSGALRLIQSARKDRSGLASVTRVYDLIRADTHVVSQVAEAQAAEQMKRWADAHQHWEALAALGMKGDEEVARGLQRAEAQLADARQRQANRQRWTLGIMISAVVTGLVVIVGLLAGPRLTALLGGSRSLVDQTAVANPTPVSVPTNAPAPTSAPYATDTRIPTATLPPGTLIAQADLPIDANFGWVNSRVQVEPGDWIVVQVQSGTWTALGEGVNPLPLVSGVGYSTDIAAGWNCSSPLPAPLFTFGALIARIQFADFGNPVYVGDQAEWAADVPGFLHFRINDGDACMADNKGQLTVAIKVYRP